MYTLCVFVPFVSLLWIIIYFNLHPALLFKELENQIYLCNDKVGSLQVDFGSALLHTGLKLGIFYYLGIVGLKLGLLSAKNLDSSGSGVYIVHKE